MELERGKVTMVIPMYNKISAIKDTLESVVKNHGKYPFECIIVDDASTDGSSDVAIEYEHNYPDLFTYVRIQHHGGHNPANARNFGIRLCDSEFICFLDADDELCEGHIDRCMDFLNEHKNFRIYGENSIQYNSNEHLELENTYDPCDIWFMIDYNANHTFHFSSFVYRSEDVKEIKFKEVVGEDAVFLWTALWRNKFYVNLTKTGMIYHIEHSDIVRNDVSGNNSEATYNIWNQIIKDNPDFPFFLLTYDDGEYERWMLKPKPSKGNYLDQN